MLNVCFGFIMNHENPKPGSKIKCAGSVKQRGQISQKLKF